MWVGVDVGGQRKGFDIAVISEDETLVALRQLQSPTDILHLLSQTGHPVAIGVDSPEHPAEDGAKLRPCERMVRRDVCGIRWTPDAASIEASPGYYGWIRNGFSLWQALRAERLNVHEVFPTASWTQWIGARQGRSRAKWSSEGLFTLGIADLPTRTNQDQRDAIAAAWTVRSAELEGFTPEYEPIVIPTTRLR